MCKEVQILKKDMWLGHTPKEACNGNGYNNIKELD